VTAPPRQLSYAFIRPPNRRYTFTADLLAADDRLLVLRGLLRPTKPLHIEGIVVLNEGYSAVWFVYKDLPYEIGRFYQPDGHWTGYYVNICEPVHWEGTDATTLKPLIDLFLDLWITPGGVPYTLDEHEFEAAVSAGDLTTTQVSLARTTVKTLVAATNRSAFPPQEVTEFKLPQLFQEPGQ
jgi:predicted RNA-binding protein associated with RNAse of E/G family